MLLTFETVNLTKFHTGHRLFSITIEDQYKIQDSITKKSKSREIKEILLILNRTKCNSYKTNLVNSKYYFFPILKMPCWHSSEIF